MFDKRLTQMCPESKKYMAGNIILQWIELFLNAAVMITIARAIQAVFEKRWTTRGLLLALLFIALCVAGRFLATRYALRMSHLASRTVKLVLRGKIYDKLLRLGTSYREHASTAELVQESVEGVEQLESYFGLYVPQFFYAFIAPVSLFFLFGLSGSWTVAAVLLICVPLIPGTIMMVQKIAKKILAKYWGQYTQLGSTFLENLQGMTTLKAYQADSFKNEEMNRESEQFRRVTMAVLTMQLNSVTLMDLIAYGGTALGILLITRTYTKGGLSMAACIYMILLSSEFFLPMRRLGSYFHVAMNGMAASSRIFRFLNEEEPAPGTEEARRGDILLQNVNFSYDSDREVLHNVSLRIPASGLTGITGESGSGKSTVASLIMGRRTAADGTITLAGTDISRIRGESLMKAVTYIGFGSYFFEGSVRDNLLTADPDASDEMLWNVLSQCQLDDFLRAQNGLDTVLSENAENLSGGQKQRLALARAILHDSPVMIFDEATSNIDIESEEAILQKIRELAKIKAVLLISHRLANMVSADRIYCMEDGRITQIGTHKQLLEQGGTYADLWASQSALENYGKEAL